MTDELTQEENQFFETDGEAEIETAEVEQEVTEEEAEQETEQETGQEQSGDIIEELKTLSPVEQQTRLRELGLKVVPHAAVLEERSESKELREKVSKMEDRFQQILGKTEEEKPSFDDDPADYLKSELDELRAWKQSQDEANVSRQAEDEFNRALMAQENEFRTHQSDYDDAVNFLMKGRATELQAMGMQDAEVKGVIAAEARFIANSATERDINPAKAAYDMAVARGYKRKDDVSEKIDSMSRGIKEQSSGGGTKPDVTLESLAEMSDEDFDSEWDRLVSNG